MVIFLEVINSLNFCNQLQLYINDTEKFPDSYFMAFNTYSGKPSDARIEYPTQTASWHTIHMGTGWLQVYLGLSMFFFFCNNIKNSYYYTNKFKILYGFESNNLNFIKKR